MSVILLIPDYLTARLGGTDDVARRALEAFAAEEYRAGRLRLAELRRLLGLGTDAELDGFLRARDLFERDAPADLDRERPDLGELTSPLARMRAFRAGKTLGDLDPVALIREGRR